MTTNHPAHGPVSLDRLHQIREILSKAAAQSDGGNLGYAMADAVKVIDGAIAAFGAAHVGEVIEQQSGVMMDGLFVPEKPTYRNIKGIHKMKMMPLGTKFYTAPPAPISVPAAMEMDDDFDSSFEHGKAVGWNAYRAAMLQGAKPVTKAYKLPPHIYRELVNRLRDTAAKYHGCQQLREQLSHTLQEVIQPAAPKQEVK